MEARERDFLEYVQGGGQVEAGDWMPDEYRARLRKFIEMHANSELMGVLPEREWILRAPTLQRKLALTAKVQDEVGHAQLIYRVVEDLGKPREQCLEDLISGKSKFHNVFHYPTKTWGDVGVIAWLVDAAAIISQKALLKCSYAPYARIMKKICWEESFHILHGRDVVLTLMNGTDDQRELVQEALNRWWGPLMQFHGNPIPSAVPRRLRAADLGARAGRSRPRAAQGRGERPLALHRARLGRAEARRHRARAEDRGQARPAAQGARELGVGARGRARRSRVIWEVFRQERKGQAFQHAGSIEAPDERFAEWYAREQYGRRGESVGLWVVARDSILRIGDFVDELKRNYHRVDGYPLKEKLKEARERAGTRMQRRT
jgi:phenylacetate-CoA oxygenase PaaH subunit